MLSYYLKCRKNAESKNPKVVKTKKKRTKLSSNCAVCDSKKSRFIKQQKFSGLWGSLGTKTGLDKIHIFGPILF